jgi:large subunit ribosomal protein L24
MRRREEKVRHSVSIRKGDIVKVTAGRDKGKTGRVLSVDCVRMRCTVEHANMVKRHTRPNPSKNIKGGIVEREGPIHLSNVMIVSPATNKPVRVGHAVMPDGTKVRVGRQCGTTLDK